MPGRHRLWGMTSLGLGLVVEDKLLHDHSDGTTNLVRIQYLTTISGTPQSNYRKPLILPSSSLEHMWHTHVNHQVAIYGMSTVCIKDARTRPYTTSTVKIVKGSLNNATNIHFQYQSYNMHFHIMTRSLYLSVIQRQLVISVFFL